MKNIYYMIWSDLIIKMCQLEKNKKDWKSKSLYLMTMLLSVNIMTAMMWIGYCGKRFNLFKIPSLNINVFPGTMLDSFIMGFISFGLPSLLINYFAIFHKNRYVVITKKHSGENGALFLTYMFSSLALCLIPIVIIWLCQNDYFKY